MTLFKLSGPGGLARIATRFLAVLSLVVLGAGMLQAQAPANDNFTNRIVFYGATNTVTGSNVGAGGETNEPHHSGLIPQRSVWWSWVAPESGSVTLDTAGSSFDTVLEVYTGAGLTNLISVAANDDATANLSTSLVNFTAVAGVSYPIMVDGYGGANGSIQLNVRLPVPVAAPRVTTPPVSQSYPANVGSNAVFSVTLTGSYPRWFQWHKNGAPLAGATNATFTLANVGATNSGNYGVVVTNLYGSVTSSPAILAVGSAPANDFFTNRFTLTGPSLTNIAANDFASLEPGEPLHGGVADAASLWWTWTAPASGLVTLDTFGSTIAGGAPLDTVLAVYTGSSLNQLIPITANGDAVPGVPGPSLIRFRAQAGVPYQIAVAGAVGTNSQPTQGAILLHLQQSPNNDFHIDALVFPTNGATVRDDNTGATLESGEPVHLANPGGASVWWFWTAPSNGTYTADAAGSAIPVILDVFQLPFGGSLTRVGEVASPGGTNNSDRVKFTAAGGAWYYFSLDGYNTNGTAATGDLQLNLRPALAGNDNFADRLTLADAAVVASFTNGGATKELGEPNHASDAGGASLWWSWMAPATGPVTMSTKGSSFDTLLAVYIGSAVTNLIWAAANDDLSLTNHTSEVVFTAVAGVTYQITVDGYKGRNSSPATGPGRLSLKQLVIVPGGNDDFIDRYPLVGASNTVTGNNAKATKELGEPAHDGNDGGASLWWSWLAPTNGTVSMDSLGSSINALLAVYTGTNVTALTPVAADTGSGVNGSSHLTFMAVEGVEYQIAVDSFRSGNYAPPTGSVTVHLQQFASEPLAGNNNFASAQTLSKNQPTFSGYNVDATREPGEPSHAGQGTGASLWWKWSATSFSNRVTLDTLGSDFDTLLAVYTGTNVTALTLVTENDDIDSGNLRSRVTFQAIPGTTYRIAVDGYQSQQGWAQLNLTLGADAATAPEIEQNPLDHTAYTGGGGLGTNLILRVQAVGTAPLRYQWLYNSQFIAGATNTSLIITNVSAGNAGAYQVAVSNAYGSVISLPAQVRYVALAFNDNFANRIPISGVSNTVYGDNAGANNESGETNLNFEVGGNTLWWRWTAPSNGPVEMMTAGSSADTILSVAVGNSLAQLERIDFSDDAVPPGLQPGTVVYSGRCVFEAVAGQEYEITVGSQKTNYFNTGSVVLTVQQPPRLPQLSSPSLSPDDHQQFLVTGTPGAQVTLEMSTDATNYDALLSVYLGGNGTYLFTDPDSVTTLPARSFRVVLVGLSAFSGFVQTTLPVFTKTWDLTHVRVLDKDTNSIMVNANSLYLLFLQSSGYVAATNVESILGRTVYYFYPEAQADVLLAEEQQCLATGQTRDELIQYNVFGSGATWQHMNLSPLRDNGGRIYALRRQFYAIPAPGQTTLPTPANEWQAAQFSVVDVDTNCAILNANDHYIAALQNDFPEILSFINLIGRDDTYFYAPDVAAKSLARYRAVMATGVADHSVETVSQPGGTVGHIDVTTSPLRNTAGVIIGARTVSYNVPELNLALAPGGSMRLSWPVDQAGFHVQESPAVNGPWSDTATAPSVSGSQHFLILPMGSDGSQFYRLIQ